MSSKDERIVQMTFENAKFEKNCQQTIDSLHKLEESLNVKGSSKNLDELQKSLNSFSTGRVDSEIESLSDRFSTLGIVGMTAIQNITNRITDMAINFTKSITTDQITSGFKKYEDITVTVAGMLNQVDRLSGETDAELMNRIQGYIDKLSWYSDMTSFDIGTMVQALQSFVKTGTDIDEAIPIIMGIGNSITYAGKGAKEGSAAFDVYSKAMTGSYMQLVQYRQLSRTMGVTTKTLNKQYLEAAVELGELQKVGEETYVTLDGLEVTLQNFEETLGNQKGQWLTGAVSKKVMSEYGQYAYQLSQFVDIYQAATEEALTYDQQIELYNGAVTNDLEGWVKLVEKLTGSTLDLALAEEIYNSALELSGGQIDEIGQAYYESSSVARTFSEAIDAVKDQISTSFKNIFQSIFGNTLEAMDLWTEFNSLLSDTFGAPINNLAVLTKKLMTMEFPDINTYFGSKNDRTSTGRDILIESFLNIGRAAESVIAPVSKAYNAILGKTGEEKVSTLKEILTSFLEFTASLKMSEETSEKLTNTFKVFFKLIKTGKSVLKTFARAAGTLFNALSPLFDVLLSIVNVVSELILSIFDLIESDTPLELLAEKLSEIFGSMGEKIGPLIEPLANKFGNFKEKLHSIFEGVGEIAIPVIEILTTFFTELGSWILRILGLTDLEPFFNSFVNSVSNFFKNIAENLKTFTLSDWYTAFKSAAIDCIKGWEEGWQNRGQNIILTVIGWFTKLIDGIKSLFGIASPSKVMAEIAEFVAQGFLNGLKKLDEALTWIEGWGKTFIDTLTKIFNGELDFSSLIDKTAIENGFKNLGEAFGDGIKSLSVAVKGFFSGFFDSIKEWLSEQWGNLFTDVSASAMTAAVAPMNTFQNETAVAANSAEAGTKSFMQVLTEIAVGVGAVEGLVSLLGTIMAKFKMASALGGIGDITKNIAKIFDSISDGIDTLAKKKASAGLLKEIANAILKLTAAVLILSTIDSEGVQNSLSLLMEMATVMGVLFKVFTKLPSGNKVQATSTALTVFGKTLDIKMPTFDFSGMNTLIGIAGAMLILAIALKKIASIEIPKNMNDIVSNYIEIIVGFMIGVRIAVGKGGDAKSISGVLKIALALYGLVLVFNKLISIISLNKPEDVSDANLTLSIMFGLLTGSTFINKWMGSGEKFTDAIAMAGKMLILVNALKILVEVVRVYSPGEVFAAIGVIATLLLVFGAFGVLTTTLGDFTKESSTALKAVGAIMVELALFITALAGIAAVLSLLPTDKLLGAVTAIGLLLAVTGVLTTLMLNAAQGIDKSGIVNLALIGAVLAEFGLILAGLAALPFGAVTVGLAKLFEIILGSALVVAALKLLAPAIEAVCGPFMIFSTALLELAVAIGLFAAEVLIFEAGMNVLGAVGTAVAGMLIMALEAVLTGIIQLAVPLTGAITTLFIAACEAIALAVPAILAALTTVVTAIAMQIPTWCYDIGYAATGGIISLINGIWDAIEEYGSVLWEKIKSFTTNQFNKAWNKAVNKAYDRKVSVYNWFIQTISDIGLAIADKIDGLFPGFADKIRGGISDLRDSADEKIEDWNERREKMLKEVVEKEGTNIAETAKDAGEGMVDAETEAVIDEMEKKSPEVKTEFKNDGAQWMKALDGELAPDKVQLTVDNFGSGLLNGIRSWIHPIKNAAISIGKDAMIGGIAEGTNSNSPSKEAIKQAGYVMQGLVIGTEENEKTVNKTMISVGENMIESISKAISEENAPTITPVLDLTNIQNGSKELAKLTQSKGLSASISGSYTNSSNLNYTLASELTKLRSDISDLKNSTALNKETLTGALNNAMKNVDLYMDSTKVGKMITNYQNSANRAAGV